MKKFVLAFVILVAQVSMNASAKALEPATGCTVLQIKSKDELKEIFKTSPLEVRNYQNAQRLWSLYSGENFMLQESEIAAHQEQVIARVSASLDLLGYSHVSPAQALYCTNQNQTIDFDLLRYALLAALRSYYIY